MSSTATATGSAEWWGALWGARPDDWARTEDKQARIYQEALSRVGVQEGQCVLDIGCGTGVFLRLAADSGARVFGLDASEALLALARRRVPEADLRVGDMEALPYEDDQFDVVAGFSSFFFAADMVAALRDARRVAKPGAPVVMQVWGPPERNDLEPMKEIARGFLPPAPPDAPEPPKLWQTGVLEAIAQAAELTPQSTFDLSYAFEYPNEQALANELTAPMGLGALAGDREGEVRAAITDALSSHRRPDGSYHLENEFHFLIAGA